MIDWALRPRIAEEVARQYNDILRVGHMHLNGERIQWSTESTTELQMRSFCESFCSVLARQPEAADLDAAVVCETAYWFCKAVSMRYVPIIEVLQKVSATRIDTTSCEGFVSLEYVAELLPTHVMRASLQWHGSDNMVSIDPFTGKLTVQGTLASLDTEFPVPCGPGFLPAYQLQMKFNRQQLQRLSLTQKTSGNPNRVAPTSTISPKGEMTIVPEEQLCSEHSLVCFSGIVGAPDRCIDAELLQTDHGGQPCRRSMSSPAHVPTGHQNPAGAYSYKSLRSPATAKTSCPARIPGIRSLSRGIGRRLAGSHRARTPARLHEAWPEVSSALDWRRKNRTR